ncbi:class I adenylate-forming enzyme family protein [Microbacterium aurantiacum]|uniref:Acyl--CoA ligase n=1 Tax=Microbacterium aurantiacum TaxID=162393 RepID=A0ABT8FVZ2_9MICO|nr:class I adenylate-forming enzyme family protein [Microbacterium aurantiacum]MDN4465390.1 acyl--CoA ligase [Microbacterium aurantiacum]
MTVLRGRHANLGAALAAAAAQFGDRDAYVDPSVRLTFAQWDAAADAFAGALVARGIAMGDVIAIGLPSSAGFAVAYAGGLRCGAVVTGVNTRLGPSEIAGILRASGAAVLIGDLPTEAPIDRIDGAESARIMGAGGAHGERARREPARTDPAVIIWTSGTTGAPKGAWYDHAGLEAAAHSSGIMSAPFDRRLVATPFAHAGYMAKVWDQIAWGTAFVVPPQPWSAASTASLLRDERVSVASLVPTQWEKMLEHGAGAHPYPDLRIGTAATAPASPALVDSVRTRLGVPLVVRYAMTESPSITGTKPDEPAYIQFHTVGRPQAGMQLRIVDGHGAVVPTGEVGDIETRGACVMRGYWRDDAATAQSLTEDGWLRTGDLGYLSPKGHLILTGRRGDMYIRGGYNVYPMEVEKVLATHPDVAQVAVVGVRAPVIGEIGVAFAVPSPGRTPTLESLRAHVKAELADYKAPERLIVVDSLPLTPMLKVDRAALKRIASTEAQTRQSASLAPTAPSNSRVLSQSNSVETCA